MKTRLDRVEGAIAVIKDGDTVRPSGLVGITAPDEVPDERREEAAAFLERFAATWLTAKRHRRMPRPNRHAGEARG